MYNINDRGDQLLEQAGGTIFTSAAYNTYGLVVEYHFFERQEVGEREQNFKHFTVQLFSPRSAHSQQLHVHTQQPRVSLPSESVG